MWWISPYCNFVFQNNANLEISKHVIIKDNYDAVHTLVLYYQMVSVTQMLVYHFMLKELEKKWSTN